MRFSSLPEPLSTSTPKWVLTSSSWRIGRVRACRRRGKPLVVRKDLVVTGGKARVAGPYHVCRDRDVSLGPAVSTFSGAI